MIHLGESGHPLFRETSELSRGLLKSQEVEYHRYTTTEIQRWQSCHFTSLFPLISSVSTEQYRISVKNLLSKISDHSSSSTGNPVAKANDESESKVAPTVVSLLTKSPLINVPAQGNLVPPTQRKIRTPSRRHSSE